MTVCWFTQLLELKAQIEDTSLQYPDYYRQKFHAYDGGNLDWEAAWEVEVADATLAMRIFKDDKLTPQLASHELRKSFLDATQVMLSFHMLVHFFMQICSSSDFGIRGLMNDIGCGWFLSAVAKPILKLGFSKP